MTCRIPPTPGQLSTRGATTGHLPARLLIPGLLLVAALVAVVPTGAAAQQPDERRREARIDFIAGSTVYVRLGTADGLAPGDTLRVYPADGGSQLGLLVVVGASEQRASLTFVGRAFPMTRGAMLVVEPVGESDAAEEALAGRPEAVAPGAVVAAAADPPRTRPGAVVTPGPHLTGTVGLDVDAHRATSSWGGPGVSSVEQSVATPALRLRATATHLPLGLELRTNLRAGYRAATSDAYAPRGFVRLYEASLQRDFGSAPITVRAGRFWDRLSSIRSFWDGGLVRLGSDELGIGVVAGYEPARGDEGFSTAVRRWAAFTDFRHRSGRFSYSTDASLLSEEATEGWTRRVVGWAQRARWRGASFSQRLELDLDPGAGEDRIERAYFDVGVPVAGRLRLRGHYARDRLTHLLGDPSSPSISRERWTAGLSWSTAFASLSAGGGRVRHGDGPTATAGDATVYVPAPARGLPSFGLTASWWDDGDIGSLLISPSIDRLVGPVDARLAYRLYDTAGLEAQRLHGGELTLAFPLRSGIRGRVSGQGQWGRNITTLRVYSSLSYSF